MSRDTNVILLGTASVLALAFGVGGLVTPIWALAVLGLGAGSLALALAAAVQRFRSRERVSFPLALLATALPATVTVVTAARFSIESAFSWGAIVGAVVVAGLGLAFALGVARTTRQRWIVVAALAMLAELFVAAAVLDWNTHLEAEGLATLLGVAAIPLLGLLALPLYLVGAGTRRAVHADDDDDGRDHVNPAHRPLLAAVALPWLAGALALVVPQTLDSGLLGLRLALVGSATPFAIPLPIPNPLLVGFVGIGAACTYAVHRFGRPAPA
jgi:hypothetical protein